MSLGVYILRTHDLLVAAAGFSEVSLHAATVLSELGEPLLDSTAFRFKGTEAPVCFGDGLVGFLQVIFGSFVFRLTSREFFFKFGELFINRGFAIFGLYLLLGRGVRLERSRSFCRRKNTEQRQTEHKREQTKE